jgi:DmsE family decaheme c-type cytochrome
MVLAWMMGGGYSSTALAGETETLAAIVPPTSDAEYAGGGITTCTDCHDENERYPVLSILKTKHAVQGDFRTPLAADEGCETCHGPSAAHEEDSEEVAPSILFGREHPAEPQNAVCMGCHESGLQMNWAGSSHDRQNLACVSCHTIHAAEDPVMSENIRPGLLVRDGQAEVCFSCHTEQRAKSHRLSSHPVKEGKAQCSSCHDPHGSMGPSLLAKPTLNETCYQCHAEKRGPHLWEHAPAREDCSLCHDPHGTNHRPMLKARGPWLCQQCHMAGFHPSTVYTASGIPPTDADDHLLARNCMNCHTEVHGSNHPSGVRWTR